MKDVCVLPFWVLHCIESISSWYGLGIQWKFAEQMRTDRGGGVENQTLNILENHSVNRVTMTARS